MPYAKDRMRACQWCSKEYVLGVDSSQHKYCSIECRQKWHAKKYLTSERTKRDPRKQKNTWLKNKYGITIDDYELLLEKQNHCCRICLTDRPTGYNWHVDHDHDTGKVRALLCSRCNQALGLVDERLTVLHRMMEYISEHKY